MSGLDFTFPPKAWLAEETCYDAQHDVNGKSARLSPAFSLCIRLCISHVGSGHMVLPPAVAPTTVVRVQRDTTPLHHPGWAGGRVPRAAPPPAQRAKYKFMSHAVRGEKLRPYQCPT